MLPRDGRLWSAFVSFVAFSKEESAAHGFHVCVSFPHTPAPPPSTYSSSRVTSTENGEEETEWVLNNMNFLNHRHRALTALTGPNIVVYSTIVVRYAHQTNRFDNAEHHCPTAGFTFPYHNRSPPRSDIKKTCLPL
eukprot:gene11727-8072_t